MRPTHKFSMEKGGNHFFSLSIGLYTKASLWHLITLNMVTMGRLKTDSYINLSGYSSVWKKNVPKCAKSNCFCPLCVGLLVCWFLDPSVVHLSVGPLASPSLRWSAEHKSMLRCCVYIGGRVTCLCQSPPSRLKYNPELLLFFFFHFFFFATTLKVDSPFSGFVVVLPKSVNKHARHMISKPFPPETNLWAKVNNNPFAASVSNRTHVRRFHFSSSVFFILFNLSRLFFRFFI